jgi:hypothetical protein
LVVSGFAQESKQVSAADNLPSGRGSVADVRKELVEYVQTAPEFATGIDEKKKRALKAITELCEDKSEDRQTLLRLLLESPRGDLSGFKYPLPNYHPSARVLLWLALAGKLQGSENLCLAMAMSDGLFLWIGDESVQKTLRKDALDMLAFFLKTEQLQQQLGHKRLRTYPPAALVMLAWRGG